MDIKNSLNRDVPVPKANNYLKKVVQKKIKNK